MLNFKIWFIKEDSRSLAKAYSDLLKNVPQDPAHHPEGDVLAHVKLVRKAIPEAINRLNSLKTISPFSEILSDIDFSISQEERQILYLCAWLHDIGKATATTIGDVNYSFLRQMDIIHQNDPSKIRAINHDKSSHYLPLIQGLEDLAPEKTKSLYLKNKDMINFIIDHHMSFRKGEGFSKPFIKNYFNNGKLINRQEVKLLLVLMWADKMGRTPEAVLKGIGENESGLIDSFKKSIEQRNKENKTTQRQSAFLGPKAMIDSLKQKGLSTSQIISAVKGKFPEVDDDKLLTMF